MAFPVRVVKEPAALRGQQNGKLPASILGTTPGQAGGAPVTLLRGSSLRAWKALCAEAKRAGHILKCNTPQSSYRTYAEQLAIWTRRMSTTRWPGATKSRTWNGKTWWLKPGEAAVAPPGSSYHSKALAVDAGEERDGDAPNEPFDNPTLSWLIANAGRFGWSWEIQSEPWHLRYFAGDDIPAAVLAYERSLAPKPTPQPPALTQENDMAKSSLVKGNSTSTWYVVDGIHRRPVANIPGGSTREQQVAQMIASRVLDPDNSTPWTIAQDTLNAMVPV